MEAKVTIDQMRLRTYLLNHWIVGCSGVVLDTIDQLQRSLGFGRYTVVSFVVGEQAAIGFPRLWLKLEHDKS